MAKQTPEQIFQAMLEKRYGRKWAEWAPSLAKLIAASEEADRRG